MADVAEFVVSLIDKVTKPSKRMTSSLQRVTRGLDELKSRIDGSALGRFSSAAVGVAKSAAVLGAVLATAIAASLTAALAKMGMFVEKSRLAFRFLTGSAMGAGDAMSRSARLATSLGLDFEMVTKSMMKMRAMQFSLGESEDLIKMGADLRAIGADAQQVESALLAVTQIKAKGKLQAQELVLQLGNAGVATTLVYKQLALQLGKTEAEVQKLIQKGKISADVGIAAIKAAVMEKVGERQLGTAGTAFAQSTVAGALGRLRAAPGLLLSRVGNQTGPAMAIVKRAIDQLTAQITALDTRKFAAFFERLVSILPQAVTLVGKFTDGFAEGFSSILEGFGALDIAGENQKRLWFLLGETAAKAFGLALKVFQMVGKAIAFLTTPTGQVLVGFAGTLAVLPKLISPVKFAVKTFQVLQAILQGAGVILTGLVPIVETVVSVFTTAIPALVASVGLFPLAIGAAVLAAGFAIYHWWDDIKALFRPAWDWMSDAGAHIVEGLASGIITTITSVGDATQGVLRHLIDAFTELLDIGSPSRVTQELGLLTTSSTEVELMPSLPPSPPLAQGTSPAVRHIRFGEIVVDAHGGRPRDIADALAAELARRLALPVPA